MKKKLFIFVILLLVNAPVFAETVDTAWVRTYNGYGVGFNFPYAVAVDDSCNVYVTGQSGSPLNYATIKYYPNGDTAWVRRYSVLEYGSVAYDVEVDYLGNVYVAGYSNSRGTDYDFATIKYYPNGCTAWVRIYNGPANGNDMVFGHPLAIDRSGNVYVSGSSQGNGTDYDFATIKYYPNGDTAWVRRYNGPTNGYDGANDIAVDDSGNTYVTGTCRTPWMIAYYTTIKYFSNGDTAWVRSWCSYGNPFTPIAFQAVDRFGNAFVTAGYYGEGWPIYSTVKYSSEGEMDWIRTYDGKPSGALIANNIPYAIAIDSSGNVYVTGYSNWEFATIKYHPDGDTAWVRRYTGTSGSEAFGIAVDDNYNVYVAGISGGNITTIKYDSLGNEIWLVSFDDSVHYDATLIPLSMTIDRSGNVYVTAAGSGGDHYYGDHYVTIKYIQTPSDVNDETGNRELPYQFILSQNYPNPFNLSTKIEFVLPHSGFVSMTIFDILGRTIRTLVSENLPSGYKSVIWDGKNVTGKDVASGIYFYQLRVGDFSEAKKMLLLK
jgi:hypothetical protein